MRIGIDLGGTKIEAIALGRGGETLSRRRVPTPRNGYRETLNAIAGLVEDLEAELGLQGSVGIGIPGALSSATGRVKNANSTCLIGERLDADLERALKRPVRLANDANCFALSEAMDGAGAGATSVFGVILGTGVGGGIVIDGRVVTGVNAIAGEWGHNPLPWPKPEELPGPSCYCGRYGCIETFLSGPGLFRDWFNSISHISDKNEENSRGAETVVEAARQGDAVAEAAMQRYEERLSRALAHVINILDPEVVVLGGGLSGIGRLYGAVAKLLPLHVFSDRVDTVVRPPRHGDSSGVRGAAWLWPDDEA